MNKAIPLFLFCFCCIAVHAQEIRARVTVVASRVNSSVDKKTFQTLETSLNNFVNNRKWTNDNFKQEEKISCNFLLNLESTSEPNVYKATLAIQSGRPVFNSAYISPVINYQDADIIFKYVEFQQLEFNEARVSGTDPLTANLTAVFAYWIQIILGYDYDSFSVGAGKPYFQKAQNIVNNAPDGRNISGWKAFDGTRNRYWLAENMVNSRYNIFHDIIYNYYRTGLDKMYDGEAAARTQLLNILIMLNTFNTENTNTMALSFFFQAKSQELAQIFAKAPPQEKTKALDLLKKLDVTSSNTYDSLLK